VGGRLLGGQQERLALPGGIGRLGRGDGRLGCGRFRRRDRLRGRRLTLGGLRLQVAQRPGQGAFRLRRTDCLAELVGQLLVALAARRRRLDLQSTPKRVTGVGVLAGGPARVGEGVEGRRGIVGPLQHNQRLGAAQERGIVGGRQRERFVERGECLLGLAEPELDGAQGGARHGPIGGEQRRLAV
jgi:hypothetical protein